MPPFQVPQVGNMLADLQPDDLPEHLKRIGSDWFAVFNPAVPRTLDVQLMHDLVHASVVCCVRFSHDGRYIATGSNHSTQIFDVRDGRRVCELQDNAIQKKEEDLYIRSVCFSPDGKFLVTGADDTRIRVWDIENFRLHNNFDGHEGEVYSLDFAQNGRLISSGSADKTVRIWDLDTNQQVMVFSTEDIVTTVAISPDGRLVAAGSLDKSVWVWDYQTGSLHERLEGPQGHKDSIYSVTFSPSGREIVSGSLDKTIKMWELGESGNTAPGGGTWKCIRTFEGHKDYVLSVCLTPSADWLLSGSKDRSVLFWDPQTGNAQMMLKGHKATVLSAIPSPSGQLFATGSGDMRTRIWSLVPYNGSQEA